MESNRSDYHSYLLRMWQVQDDAGPGWRASLEDVRSGEMHGFEDLAALQRYLEELASMQQDENAVLELKSS